MRKLINGKEVELVTISKLAKMCGRKAATIRKWEFTGILPEANLRSPDVPLAGGETRKGFRLYTLDLAVRLSTIVKNDIFQGIEIPQSTLVKIKNLFAEERTKLGGK